MARLVKLRQQLAAAREELREAEAEPKVKYTTGSTAEQQEARDKASTAKSGKKRTLKKNVLMLEAAVEDERVHQVLIVEAERDEADQAVLIAVTRDARRERQRQITAASAERGLMQRLTNTDLESSDRDSASESSNDSECESEQIQQTSGRSQPVSPAVQRSPQSTQSRKRKSQKAREAEAANAQEQFEILCAQEVVVVDSVDHKDPPPAIETQPPTHSVPLTWKVGVAAIAMIAVLGFAFFQQMKTQEMQHATKMQHAQEMQEMQQALRDAEARQRLIATEALRDAKERELHKQLEDARAFSLGGTFQQLLGK